jgi:PPOX class probable F420-dependent enzyme
MAALVDLSEPAHAKALRMLDHELIAWFTTIGKDGAPRAVPVWFFWDDGRLFVMSEPDAAKVAHVRRGSPVLVHLHAGGPFGDDVVILHGSAEISPRTTAEWLADGYRASYEAKYAAAIADYGTPLDGIAEAFPTLIEFSPRRLQAW